MGNVETIIQIINSLCKNLLSSIDKNIFPLLDELVFLNKEVISTGDKMNQILSNSPNKGVLALANCLFVAFILYYASRLLLSQATRLSSRITKQILCKGIFSWYFHE